ncbi:aldehyde ferredoxin oxidoreductase family protein [Desulfohalobium retbaense]|uniref:Aldehyde ferredoxin oxidoreductase n=1 Tax=Desulfohalobium retbaense (strain ATCC 49708 / DSM 5692 / JCM 16813 / HR100) TaxID=485915 RepID=C8X5A6_DESRD|nr:aldehyde ferredoxin oxidoreductase family protein [Desulfohalobium retbaense]ACV69603.1 Aldehyde ferredoxin oxidoreductase [Desulfohalobium retbaense DSM 5692]
MASGYTGKILHVDLTSSETFVEEPSEKWYKTYMGGSAFASYYLLKMLKPGVEPLSPENILVFATSVICGAPISGYNRYTVASKSPLTNCFGESEAGGYFAPELKFAGYDAIICKGKAQYPVYLSIVDGHVEIKDARNVWGLDNYQTLEMIKEELGDKKVRVASIGPGGENLIRFANISNDIEHFNGRTGMGCVMGSKNLKAIAVRGSQKPSFADPEAVKEINKWHRNRLKNHPPNKGLSTGGTSVLVKGLNASGILPTKNFKYGTFDQHENLEWENYEKEIFHKPSTCYMCSVACKRSVKSDDPKFPLDPKYGGPEYETLAAFGSNLLNGNIKSIARANQICNLYGIDTISTGNMIAFAMECFENGILSSSDIGCELQWGDAESICWLAETIARREGIGDILAEGMIRASEKIGKGSHNYAFHIKGNDLPLHDGRGKTGMAMGYALSSTGADHVECPHDTAFQGEGFKALSALGVTDPVEPLSTDEAKVRFFHLGQLAWGINNLLSICNFCSVPIHAMTFHNLVESVRAITGWDTSLFEIVKASERSLVMSRLFNIREGLGSDDDRVISRWHEPFPDGPLAGQKIDEQELRDAIELYYKVCGWDQEGRPSHARLVDLDIDWIEDYM